MATTRSPANWGFHETFTTDGSGWFTSGHVSHVPLSHAGEDPAVVLDRQTSEYLRENIPRSIDSDVSSIIGGTLKVLGGPGAGQTRIVTGWNRSCVSPDWRSMVSLCTITLDAPLDAWFVPGNSSDSSIIAIVASVGQKAVVGNRFQWTEVIQMFGNTLGGLVADNTLTDVNVANAVLGNGSVGAFGMCYQGPSPNWFTEFVGNRMHRSDGITLLEGLDPQQRCPAYGLDKPGSMGPWIRWVVIRRNVIAGVSANSARCLKSSANCEPNTCGAVVTNWATTHAHIQGNSTSTDVVAEHNEFDCPAGAVLPGDGGYVMQCPHCVVRH